MEIFCIKFAPLYVPLERRLQTLAAAGWFVALAFSGIIGLFTSVYLIIYTELKWVIGLYLLWILIDKDTADRGGRRIQWVRSWAWWRYLKDYFPVGFEKLPAVELNPKKNYLFACFPHGMMPVGAFSAFLSDLEFNRYFPHHTPYMVTLAEQFILPFGRELMLSLGAISSSSKSISYVLSRPYGGSVCALVVGGAKESYNCKPGTYKLCLRNRKGFVRLALQNGAPLVPTFSFGENDLFDQVEGPILRIVQEYLRKWIVIAPVIPIGRGFFQYSFGIVPRRRPVTTVVGEPLEVPKIKDPSKKDIDEYHSKFIERLTQLFEGQKFKYLEKPDETKLIIE